jgi:hypothetical protein
MFSAWETAYALDPTSAADAALDPDGDGRTSLQEYQANTHPNGTFARYFAEGSDNAFFSTKFSFVNPGSSPAHVQVRRLTSEGTQETTSLTIAPVRQGGLWRMTFDSPMDFSTTIESDQPIVADRSMSWGQDWRVSAPGITAGSHGETAIEAPTTTWYLAEGATHGAFDLFYLLQNPNEIDAQVTIEYLRPAPASPVIKTYTVGAHSRRTIWVDAEGPELEATDVSAKITADRPIIVERSMYMSGAAGPFIAGHNGAGVTTPATRWFLAEGATGEFFDMYVLVANPNDTAAALTVTYLLPEGSPIVKTYTVGARSRLTISVEGEDPRLASTAVSTIVESNTQPVIVERAMWWPYHAWYESHLSAGATSTGTRWAFADGGNFSTGLDSGTETYVLIANTSDQPGSATVRLLFPSAEPREQVVELRPNSRVNVRIADVFPSELNLGSYGAIIESSGVPIVVERATYETVKGVIWSAGYAALATKLQ